jgi:hypothetical protein
MARSRNLKPSFFTNEQLAECSPLARLLFAGLWTIADRAGKLHDRPRKIRAELFPYEAAPDADAWLSELAAVGLILRYEVAGERYIKIPGFERHQKPHPAEKPSEIPEPCNSTAAPDLSTACREEVCTDPASNPHPSSLIPLASCLIPHPSPLLPATEAAADAARPAGGERRLLVFREALAARLSLPAPLDIGKDADEVVRFFQRQREAVGDDALLNDCVEAAKLSQTGPPAHLSWFVGWLKKLPVPKAQAVSAAVQ